MASLLNNASLLLNPAGSIISYQEDKIYSVLPKDGTGDFTFSGGDGGTRVNQQGYIETTPANLFTYSNDFTNAIWGTGGYGNKATITPNALANPISGVLDASLANFISSGTQGRLLQLMSGLQVGIPYTVSMYIKAGTKSSAVVYVDTAALGYNADFNLSTGTITSTYGTTATIKLITNGWYYVTVTCPVLPSGNMQYGILTNGADDGTLYIYGAMLNPSSTALPYQPTTDRLNYPRITYQNGRGALLSEPQRTNLNTNSQFISSSTYSTAGLTIVYGSTTSPDRTQNASKLVEDTGTGQRYILKSSPFGSFGTYVCSFYAKPNGREWIYFEVGAVYGYANIANGTLGSTGTFDAGWAFNNYGIEPWKDGWYRVWITGTWSSGGAYYAPKIHPATSNGNFIYTGDGVSGIYVYGIQVEPGSYPTSYIPTTSATVTRPGDVTTKTGASSIINASEGTIYVDFIFGDNDTGGSDQNLTMLYSGGYSNSVFFACYGSSIKKLYGWITNGATQVNIQSPTLYKGQRVKAALTYKNNDYIMYVNGVSAGTQAQPVPSLDTIIIGNQIGGASQAPNPLATTALFNTRLTNTQLAELTTVRSGSGGNISYYGPYTIHTFTGSATFTPSFTGPIEVLVVAAGGGGGVCYGGGGGAGGVLYASSYSVSQGTGVTVTIGSGGTNQVNVVGNGGPGGNSSFGGLTAIGGGYGGGVCGNIGGNGGSGGGGSGTGGSSTVGGIGTPGQGNNGNSSIVDGGGGGGGAGTGNLSVNRQGGDGLPYSITGFSTYYGGGGSGGGGTLLAGGLGGGGKGGIALASGVADATPYTGGGGGGSIISGTGVSGLGGAGIVIVRYLT
jgi:hypothetical protein